jgi:glycosyltransferase involved in cell wall biosynthesis
MTDASWPATTAILIPAYKAAATLDGFLAQLLSRVPAEHVFVVDDGSGDGTPSLSKRHGVTCTCHEVNRGKGRALRTGFELLSNRGYSWVITMDADGQHAIDDLNSFLEATAAHPGCGMIIGSRQMVPGVMPFARILSNRITSGILSLMTGTRVVDSQCGYRAYALPLASDLPLRYDRFETESEVIMRVCAAGAEVLYVPIQTVYSASHSHISHVRDTVRWVRATMSVWRELRKKR